MKDFDLEKLERKNIYSFPENMFENIQDKVLSGVEEFDLEQLERKNIYQVSDNIFENVQANVMNAVSEKRNAPIFKLNWAYAAAASLALIFGSAFLYNSYPDSKENNTSEANIASHIPEPKKESEIAYETLQSDLTSVEKNNQTIDSQENQQIKAVAYVPEKTDAKPQTVKPVSKKAEAQMTEYLDSFSNSEIAELANNSTQDVYLDLYN